MIAVALLGTAVLAAALIWGVPWSSRSARDPENPLANARFTRVTDFAGDELDAAISPDGRFVAFVSDRDGQFDVWLSQIGSGAFRNLTLGKDTALPAPVRAPGFSPDGSQVWMGGGSGRRLQIMPLMGGALRPFLSDRVVNVSWSPDNQRMAYHTRDAGRPDLRGRPRRLERAADLHRREPGHSQSLSRLVTRRTMGVLRRRQPGHE